MTTLAQLHNFGQLIVKKEHHSTYEKANPLATPMYVSLPNDLFGIEVEVENMHKELPTVQYYWNVKEDNSLRNHGLEFVSYPLRGYQIEFALDYLKRILHHNNTPDFSPRTSVHVHMNARDLTEDQVKCFVMLYTIFEKHFFHIAGTKRESSIFCVPFYKTSGYKRPSELLVEGALVGWHKYNALNLGTLLGTNQLPAYGTIEFRHLYGTDDKVTILNWINNIMLLKSAARNIPYNVLLEQVREMNTTSSYVDLYQQVFKEQAMLRKMEKYDFESCVTYAKRWEWGENIQRKYKLNFESVYFLKNKANINPYSGLNVIAAPNNKADFIFEIEDWDTLQEHKYFQKEYKRIWCQGKWTPILITSVEAILNQPTTQYYLAAKTPTYLIYMNLDKQHCLVIKYTDDMPHLNRLTKENKMTMLNTIYPNKHIIANTKPPADVYTNAYTVKVDTYVAPKHYSLLDEIEKKQAPTKLTNTEVKKVATNKKKKVTKKTVQPVPAQINPDEDVF